MNNIVRRTSYRLVEMADHKLGTNPILIVPPMDTHEERKEFCLQKKKELASLRGQTLAYSEARKPYTIGMGSGILGIILIIAKDCLLQTIKNEPIKPALTHDLKLGIVPILTAMAVVTYIGLGWAYRARRVSNMKTKINCVINIFNEMDRWKKSPGFKL